MDVYISKTGLEHNVSFVHLRIFARSEGAMLSFILSFRMFVQEFTCFFDNCFEGFFTGTSI